VRNRSAQAKLVQKPTTDAEKRISAALFLTLRRGIAKTFLQKVAEAADWSADSPVPDWIGSGWLRGQGCPRFRFFCA